MASDAIKVTKDEAMASLFPDGKPTAKGGMSKDHFDFLWGEYEKQMDQTKKYQEQGMDIYPRPGVVMKSWVADTLNAKPANENNPSGIVARRGQKVFINLCAHDLIGAPEEVVELPEHMKKDGQELPNDGSTKLRMPLSCGPLRQCFDTNNNTGLVIDVVFNPEPLSKFDNREYRSMVAQFALANVAQKFGLGLTEEVKFPKMKYKRGIDEQTHNGNPPPQRIRKPPQTKKVQELHKKDPLQKIEEDNRRDRQEAFKQLEQTPQYQYMKHQVEKQQKQLPEEWQAPGGKPAPQAAPQEPDLPITIPDHKLFCLVDGQEVPYEASSPSTVIPTAIVVHILVPLVAKASELDLEISSVDLGLVSLADHRSKHHYNFDLQLPYTVDDLTPKVRLRKKLKAIVITLQVMGPLLAEPERAPPSVDEEEDASEKVCDWRSELPLANKLIYRLCA